ncbi:MAG TPA: thioredoxin domain-containing protein, partial [Vulgatibacter sp.]
MSKATRPANRLAHEASPYLRQHMYNPVDWYPWGDEAFEKAEAEQKPILLSVGYAACHWCHVMEKDAFEVDEVAALMNRDFVSIKVDREERPDVDSLYQGVVQLMGRGGGWPLTVFLTPDRRPFFGGTYFPPKSAYGLPGFSHVLQSLADAWANRRDEVLKSAASFEEGLSRYARLGVGVEDGGTPVGVPDLVRAADRIVQEGDTENGGFFGAPKFPHPMELAFLLRVVSSGAQEVTPDRRAEGQALLRLSLDRIRRGGIYDQLAGGFHRYAVDEAWAVPHFEKMLYDNALLLRVYAEAAVVLQDDDYAVVAKEIAAWLSREMQDTKGAFYSSQDADSEGVEGKFFVWTKDELRDALGPKLAEDAAAHYGVTDSGNFEHGATVLHLARADAPSSDAEVEKIRRKLLEAREKRDRPATDDKVIAAWNGLAIGGLAAAGRLLRDPELVHMARQAAECLLQTFE